MPENVTKLLADWRKGDAAALDRLLPLVYDELHRLAGAYMRQERSDHTLQPTALVHEAFLHLIDQTRVDWRNRAHFIGVTAHLMRRVVMKHARSHQAAKRGGGSLKVTLTDVGAPGEAANVDELLALNEALSRLRKLDERQGRIVELRFFGSLESREIEEVLGVSRSTVDREWRSARAWLKRELLTAP
ncbi:MAG: sigma-70 family RNA polymerase sigma factor [Deltaproteobacteria bacterium]|nr:sigma-70 family RNA polymerase sigma factor [Deltaproteobacteria bacterium]